MSDMQKGDRGGSPPIAQSTRVQKKARSVACVLSAQVIQPAGSWPDPLKQDLNLFQPTLQSDPSHIVRPTAGGSVVGAPTRRQEAAVARCH